MKGQLFAYGLLTLLLIFSVSSAPSQFTTTGNVGIGVTNPSVALEINGSAKTHTAVFSDNSTQIHGGGVDGHGWHVMTAGDSVDFSVAGLETSPWGLFFSPDGSKMFVLGNTFDNLYRYDLNESWNISTATFTQNLTLTQHTIALPTSVAFSPDGTRMYIGEMGLSYIRQFSLAEPWNITEETHLEVILDGFSGGPGPEGIFFKPDGTHMYVTGQAGAGDEMVADYELSEPWNISTYTRIYELDLTGEDSDPTGVYFRSDGRKMFVAGDGGNTILEYDLGIPWNISTSILVDELSIGIATWEDVHFSTDGSRMYVLEDVTNIVRQYELGVLLGGAIGVGVSSPSEALEVSGGINVTGTVAGADVCDSSNCLSDASNIYGFARITSDQTQTTSPDELGNGVSETTVTNGVSWDSGNNEFDISTSGIYEVNVAGLFECSTLSDLFTLDIQVNGTDVSTQTPRCESSADPIGRSISWIGTVGAGGTIDTEIDAGAINTGWETGSSISVRKIT